MRNTSLISIARKAILAALLVFTAVGTLSMVSIAFRWEFQIIPEYAFSPKLFFGSAALLVSSSFFFIKQEPLLFLVGLGTVLVAIIALVVIMTVPSVT